MECTEGWEPIDRRTNQVIRGLKLSVSFPNPWRTEALEIESLANILAYDLINHANYNEGSKKFSKRIGLGELWGW